MFRPAGRLVGFGGVGWVAEDIHALRRRRRPLGLEARVSGT
jgi:hypothetical protein